MRIMRDADSRVFPDHAYDLSRHQVMGLSVFGETRVVVDSDGIYHILIDVIILGQHQTFPDDLVGMIPSVCCVEALIDRQNVLLDVCLQFAVHDKGYCYFLPSAQSSACCLFHTMMALFRRK